MATAELTGPVRHSGALLVAVIAALSAASPAAAQGHYEAHEPATALANPATVFLQATWTGVVRDHRTGAPISAGPIVVQRRCSAVVINPAGYAVSTTLCVKPGAGVLLANALGVEGRLRVARGELADDQVDAFIAGRLKQAEFTGTDRKRPPKATVAGWLAGYSEVDGNAGSVKAAVRYAQPSTAGDVAVVKLGRKGLPAVEIVEGDTLREGQAVVLAGYAGDGRAPQTYELRNRATTVGPRDGTNRLTVADGIGPQARGGAVVDESGRLIGLQDNDVTVADNPVRDLVKTSHILRALDQAGVVATIGPADRDFRAGLKDYFAGRFTEAAGRFGAVLATAPTYQPAQAYRRMAVDRRDVDGDAIVNAADWTTYALSAAGGVAILALVHWVGRWRRPAADPPEDAPEPAPSEDAREPTMSDDTVVLELDESAAKATSMAHRSGQDRP